MLAANSDILKTEVKKYLQINIFIPKCKNSARKEFSK